MSENQETAVLDLGSFDLEAEADAGAEMDLLAPRSDKKFKVAAGDKLGITFHVLGDESPIYRDNLRKMIDEVQMNLQEEPKDPDTIQKLSDARTAACALTGWSGKPVLLDGRELEFSRDNATKLMYERPWICRQVNNFRVRPGNFEPR